MAAAAALLAALAIALTGWSRLHLGVHYPSDVFAGHILGIGWAMVCIHIAESGHPLVGEPVYIRDYQGSLLTSGRLLLHAATLGFEHPVTGERVSLSAPLPPDFTAVVDRLRERPR